MADFIVDDGNAIGLSAGQPTVTAVAYVVDDGNALALAAGEPEISASNLIVDDGNSLSLSAGLPAVAAFFIDDDGNSLALTAGEPEVSTSNLIVDDGNTLTLAAGSPEVSTFNLIEDDGNSLSLTAGLPAVAAFFINDDGNTIALTAGLPTVIPGPVDIDDDGNGITLSAGAPHVTTLVFPTLNSLALSAGLPHVTTLIYGHTNSLTLSAGVPTVTWLNPIVADQATLTLSAGEPSVTADAYILDNGNSLGITAGLPTVVSARVIVGQRARLRLTAGVPAVISPQSPVLTSPTIANIGEQILVASSRLSDTTRNDVFESVVNPSLWGETSTGVTDISVDNGIFVELNKTGGGSSYELLSSAYYVSGDIYLDYRILSDFLADDPSDEVVYAGLSMDFVSGEQLVIKRKIHPGFNGHQIQVEWFVDGVYHGGATRQTIASSGRLRLIKHGRVIAAVVDSDIQPLFQIPIAPTSSFRARLYSTTNGQSEFLRAKYVAYNSGIGTLLGLSPLISKSLVTNARIIGKVPFNETTGLVDVLVFNHFGQIGILEDGFEYPLVLGQSLSGNDGLVGNVQGDLVLRN